MIRVDWGTPEGCDICGERKNLWFEPSRFNYYSCTEHKDIAPAHRHLARKYAQKEV